MAFMGHDTGCGDGVEQARAGARMALTRNQIGLFTKQGQTDFMNSPG